MILNNPRTNFRVDQSYENEFALAASAEVMSIVALGLLLTSVMPDLPWAIVSTTTGIVSANGTEEMYYPVTNEEFSLWANACFTAGMKYTYDADLCDTRYQTIQAFSTMATIFTLMAVIFGIMPFSPVAPQEPKRALTHSMLSHMASGIFALISWAVFYGGLVFGVWTTPSNNVVYSDAPWENKVIVTYGGIVAVSGWCASFCAWVLSLSAMIKYDSAAAEQAVINHKRKKEEKRRRKEEMIERLGEGAARAAREGIALELGDKLYLGGTIAAGGASAIAWMSNCMTPFLLQSPNALPISAAAAKIINVVAATIGAIVLLIGLSDLIPRPKASVGGFSVFAVVTVISICEFGMAMSYFRNNTASLLSFEAAVGSLGIGVSLATTIVLYHPFKIWERVMIELPRPAKIHKGKNGLALVITAAVCCLLGFGLASASVTIFLLSRDEFSGIISPSPPTGSDTCPNGLGDLCYVGSPSQQCCQEPLQCVETAFTKFTCQYTQTDIVIGTRNSYSVAQAFLALFISCAIIAYVFAAIALTPNGVMDVQSALGVCFALAFVGSACGVVSFAVLQGIIMGQGLTGMPRECGYLLGGFLVEFIGAWCGFFAWWPYHTASTGQSQAEILVEAQRDVEIEQLRLEALKLKAERLQLESSLGISSESKRRSNGANDPEEMSDSDSPMMKSAVDLQVA